MRSHPCAVHEMDYFCPGMTLREVNRISMLGLAHIGDGVYELLTRTMLCRQGHSSVGTLHRLTVSYVNAPAQAKAAEKLQSLLEEDELALAEWVDYRHIPDDEEGLSLTREMMVHFRDCKRRGTWKN